MSLPFHFLLLSTLPLMAGTVMITSVPDTEHGLDPLTSLAGVPLTAGTQVQVGMFAGLSDDQILDLAAQGGYAQISGAFTRFGDAGAIGQGVEGAEGGFEIAVKESSSAAWAGESISLIVKPPGDEFLVARFPGIVFEAETETETGLDPLVSLHLADANVLVGSRIGSARFATSAAPATGSFSSRLAGYPAIIDPEKQLPDADADGDGRSNFLEYATGGNPASGADPTPCEILPDGEGGLWVRFNHVPGLGAVHYTLESSETPGNAWTETAGTVAPDPLAPATMRLHLPPPLTGHRFFRLQVK